MNLSGINGHAIRLLAPDKSRTSSRWEIASRLLLLFVACVQLLIGIEQACLIKEVGRQQNDSARRASDLTLVQQKLASEQAAIALSQRELRREIQAARLLLRGD